MRSLRFDRILMKGTVSLLLLVSTLMACSGTNTGEPNIFIKMGPDEPADLVYLFKEGTTDEQIYEFQRTVVGIPSESGTGYASLPGEMSSVKVRVRGDEAQAVNFKPDASEEQKNLYWERVVNSPLIYAVYLNAIPSRITSSPSPDYIAR